MASQEPIRLVGATASPYTHKMVASLRTVAWVDHMADQGGLEPTENDWLPIEDQLGSLKDLLLEIGRVYAPAQLANACSGLINNTVCLERQIAPVLMRCLRAQE